MKYLAILLSAAWAAGALWYPASSLQGWRMVAVVAWLVFAALVLLALWRHPGAGSPTVWVTTYVVMFVLIAVWWATLQPSSQRQWRDDVAYMATGDVQGSQVTLHSVRNFDWRGENDYTPHWETRRYDLDHLSSVDMLLSYWTGPAIAHTLVSFGFDDGSHVVFSVEIRKEQGEEFSELGGLFKRFELSVIAADERDIVRVRTNVRGEDVYLYRIALSPEARRSLFLAFVAEADQLAARPRFYQTVTTNCTTLIWRMMAPIVPDLPLDYRLLLSGYLAEYVHDVGGLDKRHSLAELRALGRITDRAHAADQRPDFSAAIRAGIPPLSQELPPEQPGAGQ